MKAFVGHSFSDKDSQLVRDIKDFIESAGIECTTGEKAQNSSVAEKVKERIKNSDIFVGVFTHDNEVFTTKEILRSLLSKAKEYTTSNWVIQECGFALGLNKALILLVERGIHKFPELQGDMELIYFTRESLQDAFLKLNQMLGHVKGAEARIIVGQPEGKLGKVVDEQGKESIEKEKAKQGTGDRREIFSRYFNALDNNNPAKLQEIYENELTKVLSDKEKVIWKAVTLRLSYHMGETGALQELQEYAESNKDNPDVSLQLAILYEGMDNDKAKQQFLEASKLYDKASNDGRNSIVECYHLACKCIAKEGKYEQAYQMLYSLLHDDNFANQKATILSALADISKMNKDWERFFAYAEGSLDLDASSSELRFSLAYQYKENEHHKLSLLHYKNLTSSFTHPIGLNNLGVGYNRFGLLGKSIASYLESAKHKNTLAMANIAQAYLEQGFWNDAEATINKANNLSAEGIEVYGNIGYATNRMKTMKEKEDSKESEILIQAGTEREFRIKHAKGFFSKTGVVKADVDGLWQTPYGKLDLSIDDVSKTFKIEEQRKEAGEKNGTRTVITISGSIEKLSGKYDIKVEEIIERTYLSTWSPEKKTIHKATGYMLFDVKNLTTIDIMEKDKEENIKFLKWEKAS
ncbi:nucleotide-binding protein [Candidatus Bathyarchaeota archaeon]|nr:nucleotide-binding protein [Candidatus Bathyarchaeota archaeon]